MLERTRTILSILEQADWFSMVGRVEQSPISTIILHSWEQAIEYCASASWEDVQLEASNLLADALVKHAYQRYQTWNTIVDEIKVIALPFIERKVESVTRVKQLPKVFVDSVNWDIIHIGIAAEYGDIVPVDFHALQANWYVKGHFPCGWEGEFPQGKLIVY